jgi:cyclase
MSMRRRSFLCGASALIATGVAASGGTSQRVFARANAEPTVTALSDHLFLIQGAGGNVTVLDSPQGVLMVDGGSPEGSASVLRLVQRRTGKQRVEILFNTHWHWDQTGSNRTLGPAGTRIIAHENTRLWLGTEVQCKWQHRSFQPLPSKARPTQTFYTSGTLEFGGERIDYGYLPQAHTDGDIYVFFRQANVLVASDVLAVGRYPILDYSTNGWIGGMANATEILAELCTPETRVIPGSGPVQTRADLQAEHQMLVTLKQRLSKLLAQGMSVQDMLAAAPTREFDAQWGDPTLFVSNAWPGLVARSRELGVSIV